MAILAIIVVTISNVSTSARVLDTVHRQWTQHYDADSERGRHAQAVQDTRAVGQRRAT